MIEKYLKAQISVILPELSGRIFPSVAPENTGTPYAVYSCTGSGSESTLVSDNTLFTETIQLDIYDDTYKAAKGYFDTLRTALMDYHGDLSGYPVQRVKVVNAMDGYESEVLEQKTTLEFEIYY